MKGSYILPDISILMLRDEEMLYGKWYRIAVCRMKCKQTLFLSSLFFVHFDTDVGSPLGFQLVRHQPELLFEFCSLLVITTIFCGVSNATMLAVG